MTVHSYLRDGQPVACAAFGDATACTYCEARGLCRKGFWESTALPDLTS